MEYKYVILDNYAGANFHVEVEWFNDGVRNQIGLSNHLEDDTEEFEPIDRDSFSSR